MSSESLLIGLALVVILSVIARLFGGLAKIPVIVPLLVVGVIAGTSVAGVIEPDKLLGDSLGPFIQIVVALILFEGALGLRFAQFPREARPAVLRLITLGVLITWSLGAIGGVLILDLPTPIAVLVGAILIVSGPTVVLPLLAFVRPPDRVREILKWEGVIMDPIGALVAVVVFAAVSTENSLTVFSLEQFVLSLVVGVISGVLFALLLMPLLGTHRLASADKVAATLMMVVAAFLAADLLYQDAGLAAALVMGVALANQARVKVDVDAFQEILIPILLGILFVLLAANIDIGDVIAVGLPGLLFVLFLAFLVRPLAVLTTIGVPISWKERLMMMTFSARGIVAAATAPLFGLALVNAKIEGAEQIVPVVFLVIAGTVLISSVLSPFLAKRLEMLGASNPSMLVVGTPGWAIALGRTLEAAGAPMRFWTVDKAEAKKVESAGLKVSTQPIDPRNPDALVGLNGVSLIAIATNSDTLNELLAFDLSEVLEPDQIYRVRESGESPTVVSNSSRVIDAAIGVEEIEKRLEGGAEFVLFDSEDEMPEGAVPFVVVETTKTLDEPDVFFHCDRPKTPRRRKRQVAALVPQGPAASTS